jgi:mannitol-1-phosphate/altronate dehydrogenase
MDGSEKIQQRWVPVLASRLETQSPVSLMAFGLASWMIYLEGPSVVQDPRRDQLQRLLADQSRRAQAAALIQDSGMFLGVTSHSRRLIGQVAASLESIDAHGGSQALSQLLRDQQRGDAS